MSAALSFVRMSALKLVSNGDDNDECIKVYVKVGDMAKGEERRSRQSGQTSGDRKTAQKAGNELWSD